MFSGNLIEDAWIDLGLSSVVGQKTSLVLIKVALTGTVASSPTAVFFKPNVCVMQMYIMTPLQEIIRHLGLLYIFHHQIQLVKLLQ